MPAKTPPRLLITDLDNTLYDWFAYFIPSVYRMILQASEILDIPVDRLARELKRVHQAHHDVEHPFALLETDAVRALRSQSSQASIVKRLDPAFHEFNKARVRHLKIYPGVIQTLSDLRAQGISIIAYSESKKHAVMDRLRRLELVDWFDRIYCRVSSPTLHPDPERARFIAKSYPLDRLVELPLDAKKPSPAILLDISSREGFAPEEAAYVGDSRVKDVLMANKAGLVAVWARYGDLAGRAEYDKLVAISHWTDEDVARESALGSLAEQAAPDVVLRRRFSEVRKVFRKRAWWGRFERATSVSPRSRQQAVGISRDFDSRAARKLG